MVPDTSGMRIMDITVPFSVQTPTYPGDPGVEIEQWSAIQRGDKTNVTFLRFGAHTATHVDAPAHFIEGASRVDSMPLEALIGPAVVIEIAENITSITTDNLPVDQIKGAER